jgi:hypothetical protein
MAMGDFSGMIAQAAPNYNLYIFCKKPPVGNRPNQIRVRVVPERWPQEGSQIFADEVLSGREAVVLGIVNGDQVFIAYKEE